MGKRSLQASSDGQAKARRAFERTQWTQEQLAYEVGLNTRQSVWKFLTGRPIDRHIFIDLCFQLNLDWQEIAEIAGVNAAALSSHLVPAVPEVATVEAEIDNEATWVAQLREQIKPSILNQCGVMQSSLDVGRPLSLEQLYTPIRIVPHVRHQQWLDISDLQPSPQVVHRIQLAHSHPEAIEAMDVVAFTPKVLLLGKPGSGKTTFLNYLALQCIKGNYRPELIPLFISLRHSPGQGTAQDTLGLPPLFQGLSPVAQAAGMTSPQVQVLLKQGYFLVLLDGLDEVPTPQTYDVLQDIQTFTQTYPGNPCIITSRLTSSPPYLLGFYDAEVDDFSRGQVQVFVQRWFTANLVNSDEAQQKAQHFLDALDTEDNQPLKELVATPILLSLLCSVFLARSNFPKQRVKLYQAGLDILLQRWDQARGIQRDQIYRHFSIPEKLKLLGAIAATTYEKGQYYFEKIDLLDIIAHYLRETCQGECPTDLETLYLESEAILQAIQVQHGLIVERAKDIYSFSHLTFQEYLTARRILYQSTPESLQQTVQGLATHTLDPTWHEVLRLTANMLTIADPLLSAMHTAIQDLLASDPACLAVLTAIAQKAESVHGAYHPGAVRAFYLTLFSDRDLRLATALDAAIAAKLDSELALDLALARMVELATTVVQTPAVKTILNFGFAVEVEQKFPLSPAFSMAFADLKAQLPDLDSEPDELLRWWQRLGTNWLANLITLLIDQRQIGHLLQLSASQRALLHRYYQLNVFWVTCLQESQTTADFTPMALNQVLLPAIAPAPLTEGASHG